MFDPEILASAPLIMQASGAGDVYAKYNVLVDWKLGAAAAGEVFCPLCGKLLEAALDKCSSNIGIILNRTAEGAEALIESLMLAGLTVLIVGNTRPVASVEHNMSHFWEMNHIAYGEPSPPHGVSVGIGLVYALMMHDFFRKADLSRIDEKYIKSCRITRSRKEDFIKNCYPPGVGDSIMNMNKDWYIEWTEQQKRIRGLVSYHEQYKRDSLTLPDYRDVIKILDSFGVPSSAAKAGISLERLEQALLVTKDFRARYSIAAALSDLGLLEECVSGILETEKSL
jgi:glycerol-1-phosphate dehydrogenase [NAD(P)+]